MKLLPLFRRQRPERRFLQAEKRTKACFRFSIPPQDRPDPMEEPPPQDDDPNFSAPNPMRFPLLSRDLSFERLFFKNWGWASPAALASFAFFLFCEKERSWPGSKGIVREKHRPFHFGFRFADFRFWAFLFQSAFRNQQFVISNARPVQGMKSIS